ncbi:MAG: hypothetical protein SVM79_00145 [Chloroflexota bacterium]|nr:hypothetical protein [Chloroflexota bacterium]
MHYQDETQPGINIIWGNEMDMYNTHLGQHPIGIRVLGKDFFHGCKPEAKIKDRIVLQFGNEEHIREDWRGNYLVMTPDLECYQILANPSDAFGSWSEILGDREIIII